MLLLKERICSQREQILSFKGSPKFEKFRILEGHLPICKNCKMAAFYFEMHPFILKETDTFLGEATLSKCFCLPSEKRSTLKGNNVFLKFFFYSRFVFRKGMVSRKANRKSQKVTSLVKWQPGVSIHLNNLT